MTSYGAGHPLARSGAAALSDLETPEWRELFARLEGEQSRFLEHEAGFRSPEYLWPRDPLHNWSRCWEYPFTYHHLQVFRAQWPGDRLPRAVDLGSGVTFFPFAVARLGYQVTCLDVDPVCRTDLDRAARLVDHRPGEVSFRLIESGPFPLESAAVDVVFCVSVLEHIPEFGGTVREIARVLKPGGLLVLTIDLDLKGNQEIGVEPYKALLAELARDFEYRCPEVTVHPADLLRTTNGPYPFPNPSRAFKSWFFLKQRVIKPLLGRPPRPLPEYFLAVKGFVLTRRG